MQDTKKHVETGIGGKTMKRNLFDELSEGFDVLAEQCWLIAQAALLIRLVSSYPDTLERLGANLNSYRFIAVINSTD